MADLPTSRVSDAERDRVVTLLREHCVAGRLSLDEFSERVGGALRARTVSGLEPALRDLPSAVSPLGTPKRKGRRWVVAFMSGADVKGRWRAGGRITAVAVMGGCKLDLRGAQIEASELHITAFAFWGGIDIILPEGIDVDVGGMSIMGGRKVRMKEVAPVPGSPRVSVRAFPVMAGISVRSKPLRGLEEQAQRPGKDKHPRKRPEIVEARSEHVPLAAARADDGGTRADDGGTRANEGTRAPEAHARANETYTRARAAGTRAADAYSALHTDGALLEDSAPGAPAEQRPASRAASGVADLAAADGTVTILFSDISDYTGMIERLGDRAVQEMLVEHRRVVRNCVTAHAGREVKFQGDGFMLAFAGVARALRCAAAIQRSLAERAISVPERSISVHMGIHTGEALLDGDDYAGHTVVLASRLADAAAPGEVLVSSVAMHLVGRSREFSFGPVREVLLKGLREPEPAAAFSWDRTGS